MAKQSHIGEKMIPQNEIIEKIKNKYPYLSSQFGIRKIGLFGSIAEGTQKEDSDIDLIVDFKRPIGLKFITLVEYLEKILGKRVDIITTGGLENIRLPRVSEDIKRNIIYV
jgi:predicted nucleotidyltransferase